MRNYKNFNIYHHIVFPEFSYKSKGYCNLTPDEQIINYLNNSSCCKIRRIKRLVYMNAELGCEVLIAAINNDHNKKIIKYLIDCGCDTSSTDYNNDNALTVCIRRNRIDILDLILESRIDLNMVDKTGTTPLMIASILGNETILELLKNNGARLCVKDRDGNSVLHHAVKTNHYSIVKKLVNWGADINIRNKCGETPLCFAINHDIIRLLLKNGANPNHYDRNKNTLLHKMVKYSSIRCIKLLIDYHANPLICNKAYMNVIDYARIQNKTDIVNLLTTYSIFVKQQYRCLVEDILAENKQEFNLNKLIISYLF